MEDGFTLTRMLSR